MLKISKIINRFYSLIENYNERGSDTRYKSWEWCHEAFLENKDKKDKIDFLSLHLAFYLASWGMYRGSSFLLQRDYKAHKVVVEEILKSDYKLLWNYIPQKDNIEEANRLLFDRETGIYWKIKKAYKIENEENNINDASDTLITKILMGTFGCIPAFDRFLKAGIKYYLNNSGDNENSHATYQLTSSIERINGSEVTESFKALALFAIENEGELKVNSSFSYPPMKCVDMFFWEIGYELDLISILESETRSFNSKKNSYKRAVELQLCSQCLDVSEKAGQIDYETALKEIKMSFINE